MGNSVTCRTTSKLGVVQIAFKLAHHHHQPLKGEGWWWCTLHKCTSGGAMVWKFLASGETMVTVSSDLKPSLCRHLREMVR